MEYRGIETYEVARARGPRHETREPIGKNAVIVFAPTILAERTWNAIAVAVAGEAIFDYGIYDGTQYWYSDDLPVALDIGHFVRGFIYLRNITTSYEHFRTELEFIDPDGISRGHIYEHHYLSVGAECMPIMDGVILDKPGTWKLHVIVEVV